MLVGCLLRAVRVRLSAENAGEGGCRNADSRDQHHERDRGRSCRRARNLRKMQHAENLECRTRARHTLMENHEKIGLCPAKLRVSREVFPTGAGNSAG